MNTQTPDVFANGARKDSEDHWWFLHEVENVAPWSEMKAVDRSSLIAAAPDLLEAAEQALAFLNDSGSFVCNLLRAAIQRAKGEQA